MGCVERICKAMLYYIGDAVPSRQTFLFFCSRNIHTVRNNSNEASVDVVFLSMQNTACETTIPKKKREPKKKGP